MIISSLAQAGSPPATKISVEQETLRTRETNKIDIQFWWFTEPDEFRELLKGAPELVATERNWRVASHAKVDKLLADLILSMQAHGRPAAVTTGATEHWMVLVGAEMNNGQLMFQFLNPLPSSLTLPGNPPGFQHRFMDVCGAGQQPLLVANQGNALADLNLTIKGFVKPTTITVVSPANEVPPKAKLPPPSTVSTYINKAVGVTFGARPPAATITQLATAIKDSRLSQLRVMASNPVDVVKSNLTVQFRTLNNAFDTKAAEQTLMATDLGIRAIRLVRDLAQSNLKYVLCSGYSQQTRSGFVAAFDSSAQGELLHVQVTNNERLINSVARFPAEALYWTTRPTSHFPPMAMPYFVFRRKPGQPNTLVRLYDDAEGEVRAFPGPV